MTSRLVLVPLLVASAIAIGRAQSPSAQEPAFDVASIKPSPADANGGGFRPFPGRFVVRNASAASLIGFAYRDVVSDVEGAPDWARSERYDVDATVQDAPAPVPYPAMMRTLLRERFNFAGHVVTETRDVLALVRAKPGAPLPDGVQKIDQDCSRTPGERPAVPPKLSDAAPPCFSMDNGALLNSGGMTMAALAGMLRPQVGREVVDDTGLPGYYRFQLRRARRGVDTPFPGEEGYPDITTALAEQLGLKLVSRKADVKVMVVDRFDRPTPD